MRGLVHGIWRRLATLALECCWDGEMVLGFHYLPASRMTLRDDLVYCCWIVVVRTVAVVAALPQLLCWRLTPAQSASVIAVSLLYSRLNSNSRYYLY